MISYDPSAALNGEHGVAADALTALAPKLEKARRRVLADVERWERGDVADGEELDAGFLDLPQRMLDDYASRGADSEVGRVIAAADFLARRVDRVVSLGIGGSYMGARALFEACCHPFHNELPRGRRDRPRLYFQGHNVDNDAARGLLDLLDSGKPAKNVKDRWAMLIISKSGGTIEPAAVFCPFFEALKKSCGGKQKSLAQLIVPITGTQGQLRDLAGRLGCQRVFDIPEGVGGRFSIFSPVGLLPAAIVGLDVVKLLSGAAEMNKRFRRLPPFTGGGKRGFRNPVLDFTGVCHLMERRRKAHTRVLSVWSNGLEAAGLWYDQLLSESLGKKNKGATPLTAVNTRDLHSRGQQHQQGRRDKLITNVYVEQASRDPIKVRPAGGKNNAPVWSGATLPEILDAAFQGTNRAYSDDGRPTADIRLPRADEQSLGELLQMLMLATVLEGYLINVNPYGQPGVEAYKQNMTAILKKRKGKKHGKRTRVAGARNVGGKNGRTPSAPRPFSG